MNSHRNRSQEIAESLEPRIRGNGTEIRLEPSGLYAINIIGNVTRIQKLVSWPINPLLNHAILHLSEDQIHALAQEFLNSLQKLH